MKRYGNLWSRLISFPNLFAAARKAQRGKRFRLPVARFLVDLERQLCTLRQELGARTYRPGPYRSFTIFEPKQRLISAAPFRDRVVHHALCNVLEPIFEQSFLFDSFACRRGKGTHAAVRRCQQYARRFPWVLKADVAKFFPSIDHALLKHMLHRKIKDPGLVWLADLLIDHSNPQEPALAWFAGDDLFTPAERRHGLPLGNQTSQFFANVYLDPLDHFVKERLGAAGYLRYVDDFVVFAHDKRQLAEVQRQVGQFLEGLRLRLHATKNGIFPTRQGIRFLGYRVYRTHRELVNDKVWRFRRRLRRLQKQYALRQISLAEARLRIVGWIGHARQADTYRLRRRLFREHPFRRAAAV